MSDYNDGSGLAAILGLLAVFFVILLPLLIAFYVLGSWFLMKVFQKAGVQGGWRAWVPVYNLMVFSKLGDLSPWLILYAIGGSIVLGLIPGIGGFLGWILNLAAAAISLLAAWRVGLKLQKSPVWVVLYFFLALVWLGINAFDRSRWNPAVPAAPWAGNGFLGDRTEWAGVPSQLPVAGYAAAPPAAAYPPPAGYDAPPAGYQPPPAGYEAPPAGCARRPATRRPPAAPAPEAGRPGARAAGSARAGRRSGS